METGKNSAGIKNCFGRTSDKELKENHFLVLADDALRFSYSFIDVKENQCVGLCSFSQQDGRTTKVEKLRDFIKFQPELKKIYARTIVLFSNRECTLIPEEVYKEEDKEKYINLLFGDAYSGECYSMHLPDLGNYLVYKTSSELDSLYKELFPGSIYYHSTGFLLNTLSRVSFNYKKPLIHAHFSKNYFEMAMFSKGKLLFYNSFEFQTSEEIAYYILYALKQWKVEADEIMVSGQMHAESDEFFWLKKYVKKIVDFPAAELLPYPASLENPVAYLNILNPELCE